MFAVWAPTEFRWHMVSIAAMLAWVIHVDSPKNLQPKLTTSQGLFQLNLILAFLVVIFMILFSFRGVCEGVCWHRKAVSSSIWLCFLPLRSGSLAEPKARLVTSKAQQFSCLLYPCPLYWGCNHLQPYLTFSVTSEDLNSGPHASTASAVTHWAFYPAPLFLSEKPIALSPFLTTSACSVSRSS